MFKLTCISQRESHGGRERGGMLKSEIRYLSFAHPPVHDINTEYSYPLLKIYWLRIAPKYTAVRKRTKLHNDAFSHTP